MTAFEYGCGTVLLSFALHPYLVNLSLADSSTEMLTVLKEKIASSNIRNMTIMKLDLITDSLPQEWFDAIDIEIVGWFEAVGKEGHTPGHTNKKRGYP